MVHLGWALAGQQNVICERSSPKPSSDSCFHQTRPVSHERLASWLISCWFALPLCFHSVYDWSEEERLVLNSAESGD